MARRKYVSSIPIEAREQIWSRYTDGSKRHANYYLGSGKTNWVGQRSWYKNGQLELERSLDQEQCYHGGFFYWHENGQMEHATFYIHHKEQGVSRQWSRSGRLIGTYTMVNGTGVDLWWDSITSLSEERYYKDGAIHGLVRMWNPDQRSVWEEEHWWNDSQHGISRRWEGTKDSRLAQGYPEFYVNGKQVGKVDYMCLSQEDPTLPSYREKDNSPFRTLPRMAKQQRLKYGKQ